ncbi:MAG: hypothetical protein IT318_15355 [Anaerolineales bacterium]|nr:hypothetical protein [Anaerolineales bacterium]
MLLTLVLLALLLRSYAALRASTAPWAYAGATLDPRHLPALVLPATWTAAATLPRTATTTAAVTATPLPPTATPARYSAECAEDRVELVGLEPGGRPSLKIGRDAYTATVMYCLSTRPEAKLQVGFVPYDTTLSSAGQLRSIHLFGPPLEVQAGAAQVVQAVDWSFDTWSWTCPSFGCWTMARLFGPDGTLLAAAQSQWPDSVVLTRP